MKNWVCENCGNLSPPLWVKKGNSGHQIILGILFSPFLILCFLIGFFGRLHYGGFDLLSKLWKIFSQYKTCSKCGNKNLYKADSEEGQKVLEKFWNLSHPNDMS